MADQPQAWQEQLLERHRLGPQYLRHAQKWFNPLAMALAAHQKGAGRPILVALNGCQGSGKTTLCDYLCGELAAAHDLRAVAVSLDDFYHTRKTREKLAAQVHPLFLTRGVPGTHDFPLLRSTLDALLDSAHENPVAIPRFDKALDDRKPQGQWDKAGPVDIVLLEGWCLGARPQTDEVLDEPVNALERLEDPDGSWRRAINRSLEEEFLPLYEQVDCWIMLQAPSFDCVLDWRLEQEQKLAADAAAGPDSRVMDREQIERFIRHFQRLTERCLQQLPARVDHLFRLDEQRNIVSLEQAGESGA